MTLKISPKGVENTKSTNLSMNKGEVNIGGDFVNEGKTKMYDTDLNVSGDLLQKGEFTVNDPHKFAEAVINLARTTGNVAVFGSEVIKLLRGNR